MYYTIHTPFPKGGLAIDFINFFIKTPNKKIHIHTTIMQFCYSPSSRRLLSRSSSRESSDPWLPRAKFPSHLPHLPHAQLFAQTTIALNSQSEKTICPMTGLKIN